jgi:hypothetical protein
VLETQNKYGEARAIYESIEKQTTAKPETLAAARLGIAESLLREGKAAEAESRFKQIVGGTGPAFLMAGAWNGLGDILIEQGKSKRDVDTLLEALYAYLHGVVQHVPGPGEPTDQQERAMAGAVSCFRALSQLEQDKDRKAGFETRANEELARLKRLYPQTRHQPK